MSKKLQGNGLFESSRMMLPEHREAYNLHQQRLMSKTRPQLDEQEAERLSRVLAESLQFRQPVIVKVFGELAETRQTGVVAKFDQQRKAIRMENADGFVSIPWADIVDAVLQEEQR